MNPLGRHLTYGIPDAMQHERASVTWCVADPGSPKPAFLAVPVLQRIASLRYALHCARDTRASVPAMTGGAA